MSELSRRNFIVGAGIAAAATAAGMVGCSAGGTAQGGAAKEGRNAEEVIAWEHEAEIVVCGFGGSGAITAIQASDNGASVLVLEKQPQDDGDKMNQTNSTRLCHATMMNFNSESEAVAYLTATSRGATPDDVIASWAKFAPHTGEFMQGLGADIFDAGETTEYPLDLFPEGANYNCFNFKGQGPELWQVLQDAADERDIEVLYETPAMELVTNNEGVVIGVKAKRGDSDVYVKATKAVVLATGGFEYDFDMLNQYVYAPTPRFYANPDNTGDGIRMAQAAGADLWHMGLIGGRVIPFFPDLGFGLQGGTPDPYLLVDHYGKRFMNENWKAHSAVLESVKFSTDLCDFPAIPAFSIFDQTAVDAGPVVTGGMMKVNAYEWSKDNSKEIAAGWILKGDTIEELAAKMNDDPEIKGHMDPAVLAQTLSDFNGYASVGEDPQFGRPAADMQPLSTPPYYALKMYPGGVNTFGGPRRNAKGQIVKPDGQPVGHLYGTGEMGSVQGFLYSGGGWNICEIVVSGQIAANNAVEEEPWESKEN